MLKRSRKVEHHIHTFRFGAARGEYESHDGAR
jgi:hypothetical protein